MNAPIRLHPTMGGALRDQAAAIYQTWIEGNVLTAQAMLNQVPHERTAYVVFTLTVLAVHEGPHTQHALSRFIKAVTK